MLRHSVKKLAICVALLIFCGNFAHASSPPLSPSPQPESGPDLDPEVTMTPPKSYGAKKIVLFPLEVPAYVLRGVTYPFLELSRLMERNRVPEKIAKYYLHSNVVFFPIIQAGGGDGFGGGFAMQARNLFHRGYKLMLYYEIFTDFDQRTAIALSTPPLVHIADQPLTMHFGAKFRDKNNAHFFGVGADSQQIGEANFAYDRFGVGIDFDYPIIGELNVHIPLALSISDTKQDSDNNHPSVQQIYTPSELVGFEQNLKYFVFGIVLGHDTRDFKDMPTRGGLQRFAFLRNQGLGTQQFNFNEYRLDIRQYFSLHTPRHVISLRNSWVIQQGDNVPFNLLTVLDINSPLRGFTSGRFRDRNSVLFNAEYRFPVWDYIDGTLFVDTGRVFHDFGDLSFNDWRYSVGGGIQFFYRHDIFFRLQAGYGGEGVKMLFKFGPAL